MIFSTKFVCEDHEKSSYEKHIAAPLFRKSFFVSGDIKSAEILICGLGFYDLFINGKKITKGFLAPYISNPDHIIYYDKYDIKPFLSVGENVIGVMLGDGFNNCKSSYWNAKENKFNSSPKFAISVEIEDEKGKSSFDATSFLCKKGPIIFNDLRSGIFFDKRLEEAGWNLPGKISDSWHKPYNADVPRGIAKICTAEPILITKEISPVKIYKGSLANYSVSDPKSYEHNLKPVEPIPDRENGYVYDFGENNSGIIRLKIKGRPGQRIDLQFSEMLDNGKVDYSNMLYYPDGYAQRDIYIVSSDDEEIFEPMFTYHGFRYVYVSGITEKQATKDLLTYLVMSSSLEERGTFECSDEISNKIYQAGRRSDISNFYYFPTDCPHREKNGWTGDAAASAEHMIMTIGAENSWKEWLHNIRLAQNEKGKIPGIVPVGNWGYDWCNGPAWDSVLFFLPYYVYKYRGDKEIITENAHAMLSYLEYISTRRDERGIIEFGLGDWVPTGKEFSNDYTAPLGFTDSGMVYLMCRRAEEMFTEVNLTLNASYAKALGDEMLQAIRNEYVDFSTMTIKSNCQSAQALGIYFNIFEEHEKPLAFNSLMNILERDCYKLKDIGFLGLRVIFHVLSQFGKSNLAYKIITDSEFPSYGHYVLRDFTTLPEMFIPIQWEKTRSMNHHFLGDVVQWFMRYPGGINVINSTYIEIKPTFIDKLNFVKATHKLPAGEVAVYWERIGEEIELKVSYPENIVCKTFLPEGWIYTKDKSRIIKK